MKQNKIFFAIAVIMVCSCSDGGMGASSSPSTLRGQQAVPIYSLSENTIITEKSACNAGVLEQRLDTNYYQIANGTLIQWQADQCAAAVWKGNSASAIGTWTYSSESVPIPTGTPEDCEDGAKVNRLSSDVTATMTITANSLAMELSMEFCWADQMATMVSGNYVAKGCDQVEWTRNGKTATLTLLEGPRDFFNTAMKMEFRFEGKTCIQTTLPKLPETAEVCAAAWARFQANKEDPLDWENDDYTRDPQADSLSLDFYNCMQASGFLANSTVEQARIQK